MVDCQQGFRMSFTFNVVVDQLAFPEALRWREGKLWFSDVLAGKVYKADIDSKKVELVANVPPVAAGLGWLPNGELLVVDSAHRRVVIFNSKLGGDQLPKEFIDLSQEWAFSANDMLVENDGTLWVGSYGFDPENDTPVASRLARFKEGILDFPIGGLIFPNGIARLDSKHLVVAETFADRLSIIKTEKSGAVTLVKHLQLLDGATPDGLCVDANGNIWVASAYGEALLKVNPETGVCERALEIPGRGVFDCTFGGENLEILFVATSDPDESRALVDLPGQILAFSVGVRGLSR